MINIYKNENYRPDLISEIMSSDPHLSEVIISSESGSIMDLINKQQYDVIEIDDIMLKQLKPHLAFLGWGLSASSSFDCLIKQGQEYAPMQINAELFRRYLESTHRIVDIQNCAVLIGDYIFVASFAVMLAKLGYTKIYIVSQDNILFGEEIEHLKKILFGVQLTQLSFDELATIRDGASMLVLDFNLKENPELVEILTYFNFLTEGAIFFDLNSYIDDSLAQEAEKVQLDVVDISEHIKIKYNIIKKKLNIRS